MEHVAIADVVRVFALPAFLIALASHSPAALSCTTSHYSPVGGKNCKPIPSLEAGRMIVSGKGEDVFECSGAPGGYRLYLVESDPRSWYVVERDGKRYSFERDIVYDNPPGDFPNVGQGGQVEWLLEGAVVKGLIFRVSYQTKDASSTFSKLFSVALGNDIPVVKGQSTSNVQARGLLDHCQNP